MVDLCTITKSVELYAIQHMHRLVHFCNSRISLLVSSLALVVIATVDGSSIEPPSDPARGTILVLFWVRPLRLMDLCKI